MREAGTALLLTEWRRLSASSQVREAATEVAVAHAVDLKLELARQLINTLTTRRRRPAKPHIRANPPNKI